MFDTPITRRFGLRTPILNAGMAMIARPELAAAVCRAGGMGTIGCDVNPPEGLRAMVRATRALTERPFGVDLIGDFCTDAHVDVLVEERVALVIYFWALPQPASGWRDFVPPALPCGCRLDRWPRRGRRRTRRRWPDRAGRRGRRHNRAEASTMTLFPRLRRLFAALPMAPPAASSTATPWPQR